MLEWGVDKILIIFDGLLINTARNFNYIKFFQHPARDTLQATQVPHTYIFCKLWTSWKVEYSGMARCRLRLNEKTQKNSAISEGVLEWYNKMLMTVIYSILQLLLSKLQHVGLFNRENSIWLWQINFFDQCCVQIHELRHTSKDVGNRESEWTTQV